MPASRARRHRSAGPARSRLLALLALAWLAGGCGGGSEALTPLVPGDRILAFGDSLTYGTGAPPAQSYPVVLAQRIGHEVVNAGVPGELSGEGLARLPDALAQVAPKLVVLCHGGNDMLRKRGAAAAEANLRAMIATIRASGAEVVLLGVPDPGIFLSTAEFYERAAGDLGVPIEADVIPDVIGDRAYKSDTVHPNAAGYARIAAAVEALLQKHGALP